RPGSEHRVVAHALTQLGRDGGTGRLLNELLVAPLHRTVAFSEMDHVAMAIPHDLEFHMPRTREVFLHVHVSRTERGEGFRARELKGARKIIGIIRDTHPLPATAGGGLDDDRKSDLAREAERLLDVLHR